MALETSWFTDVYLLDNGQLYEAILGWARDGKTGIGNYGVDVNREGPAGKVSVISWGRHREAKPICC